MNDSTQFIGSIPQHYDQSLGPMIFVDYAADLARRVTACHPSRWKRPRAPASSQGDCGMRSRPART
jgi:hypothetical protein